ncbi:hypothetical protein WA158_002608 [Blastocystis sp. Blastoise]
MPTSEGGHETMIHQGWFGEFYYENGPKKGDATGTGVIIHGNDHFLNDVIFFWSKNGVEINGGANLLRGVHTWCGGYGIIVNGGANRLLNCYLDWNTAIVKKFENNIILDTFWYYAHLILAPEGKQDVRGFAIERSLYGGSNGVTIDVDLSHGSFGEIRDCYIIEQFAGTKNYDIRQTQLTQKLTLEQSKEYTIDFSKHLVFGKIASFQYSVVLNEDKFVRYYAKPIDGTKVTIVMEEPVNATVTISVDESKLIFKIISNSNGIIIFYVPKLMTVAHIKAFYVVCGLTGIVFSSTPFYIRNKNNRYISSMDFFHSLVHKQFFDQIIIDYEHKQNAQMNVEVRE